MIDWATLEARNATLNAFTHFDRDATGGDGVLAGVTMGVKANIASAGLPWHAGIEGLRGRIAEADAETVAKLRAAGATIIGVLGLEEGALGAKSDNPHFGAVQNPHRLGYSPGGSSGGSGAAVAAGMVDAALGTDTMGSIRIPAAHCGVYGFKPANARVSRDGLELAEPSLDCIGPLARDLDLLEKVARVISEFGEGQSIADGAVLVDHGVEVMPPVSAAYDKALAALGGQPAQVSLAHPNSRIRFAGFVSVSRFMAEHLAEVPGKSERLELLLTYGPKRSADAFAEDRAILDRTREELRAIVAEHGFLILPTVPNPPFPHTEDEPASQADFTCLASIAGLPAIALPAGWTDDALPVGIQIVGREGEEAGLFALARKLDSILGAYRAPQSQNAT